MPYYVGYYRNRDKEYFGKVFFADDTTFYKPDDCDLYEVRKIAPQEGRGEIAEKEPDDGVDERLDAQESAREHRDRYRYAPPR